MKLPVSHHLESLGAYGIDYLSALTRIGDLKFLLKKYRRLLIREFDNSRDKEVIRWGRGRVQEREEVNRLELPVSKAHLAYELRKKYCTSLLCRIPCEPWGEVDTTFWGMLDSSATSPEQRSLAQSSGRSQSVGGCILSEYHGKSGGIRRSPTCIGLGTGGGNVESIDGLSEKGS